MYRIISIVIFVFVSNLTTILGAEQRALIHGQDFEVLPGKLSVKPQIIVYFNYACSACYGMERFVKKMKQEKRGLIIAAMPVENYPSWKIYVEAFFLGQSLGVLNKSHHKLYHRVHIEKNPFRGPADMKLFFLNLGVSEIDYDAVKGSEQLAKKVAFAKTKAINMKIQSTPTFIINNKYKLNINALGTYEMLEKAFDTLSDLNYKMPLVTHDKKISNEI